MWAFAFSSLFAFLVVNSQASKRCTQFSPLPFLPLFLLPPFQTLGFHRLHEYKFDSFSLYFLYVPTPEEKATLPPCGTKESEKLLWSMKGTVLELTW